jgi:hypothetical protein
VHFADELPAVTYQVASPVLDLARDRTPQFPSIHQVQDIVLQELAPSFTSTVNGPEYALNAQHAAQQAREAVLLARSIKDEIRNSNLKPLHRFGATVSSSKLIAPDPPVPPCTDLQAEQPIWVDPVVATAITWLSSTVLGQRK